MVIRRYNQNDELNTKSLNHDVSLQYNPKRNKWDWNIRLDNFRMDTSINSMYDGCVHKLLTGYHEMHKNPTYNGYGNRAWDLLKQNKNNITRIQVEQYSIKQLEEMRRVKEIVYLNVYDSDDPYTYTVEYKVICVNDEKVTGAVNL